MGRIICKLSGGHIWRYAKGRKRRVCEDCGKVEQEGVDYILREDLEY
jgi:transposase